MLVDLTGDRPRKVSESELESGVRRTANALLGLGLVPGERLAVILGNGLPFLLLREAATGAGFTFVPVAPGLAPREIAHIVRHCDARIAIAERPIDGIAGDGEEGAPIVLSPADLATRAAAATDAEPPRPEAALGGSTLLYTAGTTGVPKGCYRRGTQDARRIVEMTSLFGLLREDVHAIAGPLYHSGPALFARIHLALGSDIVLLPAFRASALLAAAETYGVSTLFAVPTMWRDLVATGLPFRSARAVFTAGAPMAPARRSELVAWLGQGRLFEFYGSTETGTVTVLRPEEQLAHPNSVGRPAPEVEIRVLDEQGRAVAPGAHGELHIKSPQIMTAYHKDEAATRAAFRDGFLSVGDIGSVDEAGYVYLHDRKHDLIISGGKNVYPAEVEHALAEHPAVAEAAVFGAIDERWGEAVTAAVVLRDAASSDALRAFLRDRIAAFKIPKRIFIVPLIPRSPAGKPLRRALRAALGSGVLSSAPE